MKHTLLLLLAMGCANHQTQLKPAQLDNSVYPVSPEKFSEWLLDIQEGSFYTGCIDGFIVTIERGWYVRPRNKTGHMVFNELKQNCQQKAIIYRIEMSIK